MDLRAHCRAGGESESPLEAAESSCMFESHFGFRLKLKKLGPEKA